MENDYIRLDIWVYGARIIEQINHRHNKMTVNQHADADVDIELQILQELTVLGKQHDINMFLLLRFPSFSFSFFISLIPNFDALAFTFAFVGFFRILLTTSALVVTSW